MDVIWANDIDKHACATYERNFGSHITCSPIEEQITNIAKLAQVDAVIGGPPCQGFSVAGKMSPTDPRSALVFAFMEVVRITNPAVFVMENVRGLGELAKFSEVRKKLFLIAHEIGYSATLVLCNSRHYGCATSRVRMFFVGSRRGSAESFGDRLKMYRRDEVPSRAIFEELGPQGTEQNPKTCGAAVTLAAKPVLRRSPYAGMLFNGLGRPVNPDSPAPTLPASMGGNKTPIVDENQIWGDGSSWVEDYHAHLIKGGEPYHWKSTPEFLRRLTISEAARIQGFPKDFIFEGPKSSVYSQIGNCVPCELAKAVLLTARDIIEDREYQIEGQQRLEFSE